jgi:hypothetical protein
LGRRPCAADRAKIRAMLYRVLVIGIVAMTLRHEVATSKPRMWPST